VVPPELQPERPPELSVAPADESHAEIVASIHLRSRGEAAMPPPVHTDAAVLGWLSGRLAADDVWLAHLGPSPVGYVRFTDTWLDDLYVLPEHQGQQVGSALLEVVKAHRPQGFCLWVFEQNAPARRFYERRGLIELERTDGTENEEREPDVRMAWPGEDPLRFFRALIDEVDAELGALLNRRVAQTRAVQPHKPTPARDLARERAIAEAMARRAPVLGADRLERIVRAIVSESLDTR
jgi:GNAT superfamily N-acetyltransferase/chorismate mutase